MIATTCEPLEKTAVTSRIRRREGERERERGLYCGHKLEIELELPVKRLNAELSVAGSFTLPTGLGPPPLFLCLRPQ